MKTILVPTDFSDASTVAVQYAVDLAKLLNARITFLHTYHPVTYSQDMPVSFHVGVGEELRASLAKRLKALSEEVNQRAFVPTDFRLREGLAADEILSLSEELKPEMVVMGTHGHSALDRLLFGSVTVRVAGLIRTPLLVIPEKARYSPLKKLIYATDFHDSDTEAIRYLSKIAKRTEAEIGVVHVADGDIDKRFEESYLGDLEAEVREAVNFDRIWFHLVEDRHEAMGLDEFAHREEADLVAVARFKRSFFMKVFEPSVTKKMIYHTDIPLLVFTAWDFPVEDVD